ncbi:hypothetical protein CC80DRAFT_53144 [Byssothecium circinans]|uniref:Uncharacterized protein n=1 Tax=Byssothecium circinans TaxID=147558 RepID=A0A6A5TXE0_9PLEO|nr:hypothetical protein CC80DRAFT_53144 [Byssothecium circinans]
MLKFPSLSWTPRCDSITFFTVYEIACAPCISAVYQLPCISCLVAFLLALRGTPHATSDLTRTRTRKDTTHHQRPS